MERRKQPPVPVGHVSPLSIEELEEGLRTMNQMGVADRGAFWDKHAEAFRQAVLLAIRDSSNCLLSPELPLHRREHLRREFDDLFGLLRFADDHLGSNSVASHRRTH